MKNHFALQGFSYFTSLKYDGRVGNFSIISDMQSPTGKHARTAQIFGGLISWIGFPPPASMSGTPSVPGQVGLYIPQAMEPGSQTIIAYSDKPLRLSIKIGFVISLFSFTMAAHGIQVVDP